ncbi:superoxide dismutase family protein [Mycobacterium marseillense]|uniref:superoxide dismutase family protein n=1 Tax=Mycobacterium marseillense TaxID=701042 RepID=UPI0007FD43A3|nr:superoxide dismutase family protein [Mycobacterium marseillense]MCA2266447.1 superoxide dismutase family protein [Mycobacterium marseillense]MDM3977338.1 superoxide dismutase family protein [Mycobacterium marseillense]OBJ65991.1 superoxide dismutase [Mycobacterium marseillense]
MNKGASLAVAAFAATIAPLAACANQQGSQPNTSPLTSPAPGTERLTTQLKTSDGSPVANATFEFANGYATVTVEAGPNQVLSPGFHGLQIHSVGKCEGDFDSAGSVYQAADHTGYPASGDLTALQVRSDGSAKLVTTSNSFTAADLRNSSGSSLILHQSADNLGAGPTAEPSKRIACGVIAAASATTSSTTSVTTSTTTVAVPPPSTSTSTSTITVTSTPAVTSTPTTTVTTPPSLPPGTR